VELRKWATKRKGWAPIHSGHHGGGSTGGVEVFPVFTAALHCQDFSPRTSVQQRKWKRKCLRASPVWKYTEIYYSNTFQYLSNLN